MHESFIGNRGRGRITYGRSRGRDFSSSSNRPTCQLWGKYGHVIANYWHRFDETFTPTRAQSNLLEFHNEPVDKHEVSTQDSQAIALMVITQKYSLPAGLKKQA